MNLFLIAFSAIPRGGEIDIFLEDLETAPHFRLVSRGKMIRVPPKFLELHAGQTDDAIDAHGVQAYYTILLAEEAGLELGCVMNADDVVFTAKSA